MFFDKNLSFDYLFMLRWNTQHLRLEKRKAIRKPNEDIEFIKEAVNIELCMERGIKGWGVNKRG